MYFRKIWHISWTSLLSWSIRPKTIAMQQPRYSLNLLKDHPELLYYLWDSKANDIYFAIFVNLLFANDKQEKEKIGDMRVEQKHLFLGTLRRTWGANKKFFTKALSEFRHLPWLLPRKLPIMRLNLVPHLCLIFWIHQKDKAGFRLCKHCSLWSWWEKDGQKLFFVFFANCECEYFGSISEWVNPFFIWWEWRRLCDWITRLHLTIKHPQNPLNPSSPGARYLTQKNFSAKKTFVKKLSFWGARYLTQKNFFAKPILGILFKSSVDRNSSR